MEYKYITKAAAKKAAKQGREAAIKCSADKWWFFGTCTEADYVPYRHKLGENCSLCSMFLRKDTCPLMPCVGICTANCNEIYWEAYTLSGAYDANPTATNFKKFQQKARKLARVIGRLK